MTNHRPRIRIGLLIAAHLLVGVIMSVTAKTFQRFDWPIVAEVAYLVLISTHMLLLGMWIG